MTLRIDFRRDHDFTGGYDNEAHCTTPDGVTHSIAPRAHDKRIGQVRKVGATGHGGCVYRLLVALSDAGYGGQPFEAHDGRMVCLRGVVDKKAVPVKYGGEKVGKE